MASKQIFKEIWVGPGSICCHALLRELIPGCFKVTGSQCYAHILHLIPCYLCRPLGKTVHRLGDGPGKNLSKQAKCSLPGSIRLCLSNHLASREEPVRSKVSGLSWHLPYINGWLWEWSPIALCHWKANKVNSPQIALCFRSPLGLVLL